VAGGRGVGAGWADQRRGLTQTLSRVEREGLDVFALNARTLTAVESPIKESDEGEERNT